MARLNRETMTLFLSEVPEDKRFFCIDGNIFITLEELSIAIKKMTEDIFNFHVNSDKNDFANWIYNVIGDIKLADNLRDITEKDDISKKIRRRISYIKRNIAELNQEI